MTGGEAKNRLLDAAYNVLLDEGVQGLSIRRVTAEAGVNVASVNYTFGSKEALIAALFERLLAPITAERLRRLDRVSELSGASVLDVVRAFVEPLVEAHTREGQALAQLFRYFASDTTGPAMNTVRTLLNPGGDRFQAALAPLLPNLDPETLRFRIRLLIGTTVIFGIGFLTINEPEDAVENLLGFLVAALSGTS
jgi:AcrR family transcriptional regulator